MSWYKRKFRNSKKRYSELSFWLRWRCNVNKAEITGHRCSLGKPLRGQLLSWAKHHRNKSPVSQRPWGFIRASQGQYSVAEPKKAAICCPFTKICCFDVKDSVHDDLDSANTFEAKAFGSLQPEPESSEANPVRKRGAAEWAHDEFLMRSIKNSSQAIWETIPNFV